MSLMPNSGRNIRMLLQKSRPIRLSSIFFNLLLFFFCNPQWIVVPVSCSYLAGIALCAVLGCCSLSSQSTVDLWCIKRCYSVYLRCKEQLFQSVLLFYQMEPVQLFSSDFFHQQVISCLQKCHSWELFLFLTILSKIYRSLCTKILVDSQILKYSESHVWHQRPSISGHYDYV